MRTIAVLNMKSDMKQLGHQICSPLEAVKKRYGVWYSLYFEEGDAVEG